MNNVMVSLPDDRFLQLKEMAVRFRVTPEELAMVSIFNLLRQPEDEFREAMDYVLIKNAELYKRLA
ncbi:MAG: DNA-binding protein [Desulfobacteraceae bacterium IS3]|nr:MAG: DNA-binding protein [Desulfobacteraceae bacterium IS3]HAO21279.1 DNA-binding protein [Desulfobacteraceae bacterium]